MRSANIKFYQMKVLYKHIMAVGVFLTLTAFALPAQDFSSKWLFGSGYTSQYKQTWETEHCVKATVCGEGVMRAVDAFGNDLPTYKVLKGRAAAGPFKAGDSFTFEVPAENVQAGSFVSFDATLSVEPGAPMNWIVEWKDGKEWVSGRKYICHGPALGKQHRYTTIHQTFRLKSSLEEPVLKVRIRAMEGETAPVSEGNETSALAMFVTSTYVGAYVMDFGTTPPKDTTKVLCIGNSFTYYNSCPLMLKQIAWSQGHYIDMSASLKGGWSMGQHLDYATTDDLVKEGGFDVVFLQDQSQGPAKVGFDRKENALVLESMVKMADKVRSTSEDCRVVIECTWAYPGKKNGGFGSVAEFYKYAGKGAKIMAKAAKAEVSPIRDAFRIANMERPDILMFSPDGYHQSTYGSYLKSCVNYLLLYGEKFNECPADCGLEPERAAALRKIAESVVFKK